MFKKILSVILSLCLMASFFTLSASAEDNSTKSVVYIDAADGKVTGSGSRSQKEFGDYNLGNGITWSCGPFSVSANTYAQLIVWLDTIETNIGMGYQFAGTSNYVSGNIANPTYDTDKHKYKYICNMTISSAGSYNFYFSNMTAGTLTLYTPTVSY